MQQDWYHVLGIDSRAGAAEIKKAYRKKVKSVHPDLNPDGNGASALIDNLKRAYDTLINPILREEFDRAYGRHKGISPFDYRGFLLERGDYCSLSQLIFFDLLHSGEDYAVETYKELRKDSQYDLESYLDREDFMDCAYILAEELEVRGYAVEAFEFYYRISVLEITKPYFRFFFEEVIQHLRALVHDILPKRMKLEELILLVERVIQVGFSDKDTAWFMKCAAELYLKGNQRQRALFYLQESLRLDSHVSGIKDLRRRLHVI